MNLILYLEFPWQSDIHHLINSCCDTLYKLNITLLFNIFSSQLQIKQNYINKLMSHNLNDNMLLNIMSYDTQSLLECSITDYCMVFQSSSLNTKMSRALGTLCHYFVISANFDHKILFFQQQRIFLCRCNGIDSVKKKL